MRGSVPDSTGSRCKNGQCVFKDDVDDYFYTLLDSYYEYTADFEAAKLEYKEGGRCESNRGQFGCNRDPFCTWLACPAGGCT